MACGSIKLLTEVPSTETVFAALAVRLSVASDGNAKSEQLICEIYNAGLCHESRSLECLERLGYLEKVLWVRLSACCGVSISPALALSTVALLNKTARCGHLTDVLTRLTRRFERSGGVRESPFGCLLEAVCLTAMDKTCSLNNLDSILLFCINIYSRLEHTPIRRAALRLAGLPLWERLSNPRRKQELQMFPQLRRHWQHFLAKRAKRKASMDTLFFPALIDTITLLIEANIGSDSETTDLSIRCIARFFELCIDLMLQLPTRRFLRVVIEDSRILERATLSAWAADQRMKPLLNALRSAMDFAIIDQTGQLLTQSEDVARRHIRLHRFQCACFVASPKDNFSLEIAHIASAQLVSEKCLRKVLVQTPLPTLLAVACDRLHLLSRNIALRRPELLIEALILELSDYNDNFKDVNNTPLHPNEVSLWDEVPHETDFPLALPKLALQFLSFKDYLSRCFTLYRLESAHEIRDDISQAVQRLQPHVNSVGCTYFAGWSRFAVPCKCEVTRVTKSALGNKRPAEVLCSVTLDLASFGENCEIHKQDIVFLVCVEGLAVKPPPAPLPINSRIESKKDLQISETYGIRAVRGGEVVAITDYTCDDRTTGLSTQCTITLRMDPVQYYKDSQASITAIYGATNILLRRDARANNSSRVLETIRETMNTESHKNALPVWLHDVLLGYGDASAAHYSQRHDQLDAFDAVDTFHDLNHIVASFPNMAVVVADKSVPMTAARRSLFQLRLDRIAKTVVVTPYAVAAQNVHSAALTMQSARIFDVLRCNPIRFTRSQVEAIRDGMNPGLTLIIGPPGTGKTDVAVQIIANLYQNFPANRTLLIAHSNSALNDLFEKILERNIPARHLVRLGGGERELDVTGSFSQLGRVDATLARRLELLEEIQRLVTSLRGGFGLSGSEVEVAFCTCEAAEYLEQTCVDVRIDMFEQIVYNLGSNQTVMTITDAFPFAGFFAQATRSSVSGDKEMASTLFNTCQTSCQALNVARACFQHIREIFSELRQYRGFELLRTQKQRTNYLLTKQARIVAMTCTHAALIRKDLVDLGFKYEAVVVEEAAQMLEIEAFIPLVLQHCSGNKSRLERVVLIGDHHQLPPIVRNRALARHALLEQSLFSRLLRLGVPAIHLDKQGRSRPEIANLYNWRYDGLGDLDLVTKHVYSLANPGFAFAYQFVNVADFHGRGEYCPTPHFFQNLGEAEFVVAVYMYMRLLGYPAGHIAVLTTYNGQKDLLTDIFKQRCAKDPKYGLPQINTVDKYQGSQNDYVLLSLVRTKHVGHLRDTRRIVVAMSRARLGLYVFGRISIFKSCNTLDSTMTNFLKRPSRLALACSEKFGSQFSRNVHDPPENSIFIDEPTEMGILVNQLASYPSVCSSLRLTPPTRPTNRDPSTSPAYLT